MTSLKSQTMLVDSEQYKTKLYEVQRLNLSKFIYFQKKKFYPPIYIDYILNQYNNARVPLPRAIKRIWEEFKDNDKFQSLIQKYNQSTESTEPGFRQKLTKNLSSKKTYFQENIAAAKSMSCQLTIQKILKIIQQQKDVCLGCLKSLEEGKPIPKTSQLYSLVNGKSINGFSLEDILKKKFSAILNNPKGGYLFINQSINKGSVKGLTFKDNELYLLRKLIKTIKNSIFPNTFEIKIDTLEVTLQNNKTSKQIIRVSLRPDGGDGLYFVKKEVLNFHPVCSCYFLDLNAVGEINDICVLKNPEGIYKILTKHRSLKNTEQIVHKFDCLGGAREYPVHPIDLLKIHNLQLQKWKNQELHIRNKKIFILILHNELNDEYIPQIKQAFKMKKQYIFENPFLQCRSNSMKSIWLINHSKQFKQLDEILKKTIDGNQVQHTFLTFTKYLRIQQIGTLDFKQKCFKNFLQNFKKHPQYFIVPFTKFTKQGKKQMYSVYFKFSSYLQSFYIFSYLDNINVKSKVISEEKYSDASKKEKKYKQSN